MRARLIMRGALLGAAILVPLTAQAAVAAPATTGVVVDYRAQSTTATVATRSGQLVALHTAPVREGSRVRMSKVRRLSNGTLAGKLVVTGRARHARVRGVVAARIGRRGLAVSAPGTTIALRMKKGGMRANDVTTAPTTPPVGSTVTAAVTITPGGPLDADDVTVVGGGEVSTFELEGAVKAVGTSTTPPAVDATTGCISGLTSANLPKDWIAVTVGEHGLRLTAFVKLAATVPSPAPGTTTTTTTTAPVTAPAPAPFAVGQEIELRVSEIAGTSGVACENQFQMVDGSQNGDEDEADDDDHDGDDGGHHRGGHRGDGGGDDDEGGGSDD